MTPMGSNGPLSQNDANIELERHIRQNNDRLRCIQKVSLIVFLIVAC